jgi:lysophospholipase L1-like esterase
VFAVIGDSIATATHTWEMCGNRDIVDCVDTLAGQGSPNWNYADGTVSWSIASRLGFSPDRTINMADNGERWKDAFDQARRALLDPEVSTVLIGLGTNDVCRNPGHDYSGDLDAIGVQIDETLGYLTDRLPAGGEIFVSAAADVARVREVMRAEDHSYIFESCQATWDLKGNQIKDSAAQSACDHFAGHSFCSVVDNTEDGKDYLLSLLLDTWLDLEGVDAGPCGKVLSANASDTDREEVKAFSRDLNRLMAEKARAFSGANGVEVHYLDALYSIQTIAPHHVSRFDCYHPSRTGQKLIADALWADMRPGEPITGTVQTDSFDTIDYCATENDPWRTCWLETGDNGLPENGDVYIAGGRLRIRDNVRLIERQPNLQDVDEAWLSFNWRRKELDRISEAVIVEMSPDDGVTWQEITRIRGDGDDYGQQRGDYYDVSAFANNRTRLRFRSEGLGNNDEVHFDNVMLFAWPEAPGAQPR